MDHAFNLRDVQMCCLCETEVASMYCEYCDIYLCKDCEKIHVLDVFTKHKVVPFKLCITNCLEHKRVCKHYCEQCNVPICLHCASLEHRGHKNVDIDIQFKINKYSYKQS